MPSENREYFQNVVMSAAKTQVTHTIFHFHLHHQSVFLSGLPARAFPIFRMGVHTSTSGCCSGRSWPIIERRKLRPNTIPQLNTYKKIQPRTAMLFVYVGILNVGRYIFLWLKPTAVPRGGSSSGYSLLKACSFAREEAIFSCGPLYTST